MTAPGNSTVLIALLAAFIACTGYAGGRIHQWYRMGRDRDEAYRDGYDTATRSVFSMAARVLGPRRADRSAIRASAAAIIPAPSPAEPLDVPGGAGPRRPGLTAVPDASVARLSALRAVEVTPMPVPLPYSASGSASEPVAASASADSSSDAVAVDELQGPAVDARPPLSAVPDPVTSSGRHLVPDELVRAATYRLAPDRVARAKVHGALSPTDFPASRETAQRVSVPKPRSS